MRKRFRTASLTRLVQATFLSGLASTVSAAPVQIDYSGGFTTYSVQTTGTYHIFAFGAQGGSFPITNTAGGLGAEAAGDFNLTLGQVLNIAVGGMGGGGTRYGDGAGGGGGTFLSLARTLLLVAGGGGGAGFANNRQADGQAGMSGGSGGSNGAQELAGAGGTAGSGGAGSPDSSGAGGAGGGGVLANGGDNLGRGPGRSAGGASLANGLAGGHGAFQAGDGGFGGGGGAGPFGDGGGGGGYSGGGGGGIQGNGGGGGSYSSSLLNDDLMLLGGVNTGDGYLTLELLPEAVMTSVPEPSSLALFGAGLIGLEATRRKRRSSCTS